MLNSFGKLNIICLRSSVFHELSRDILHNASDKRFFLKAVSTMHMSVRVISSSNKTLVRKRLKYQNLTKMYDCVATLTIHILC